MSEKIVTKLKKNSQILESALSEYFPENSNSNFTLTEAQKYSLLGGGKRIRAFLVLEICRLLGGNVAKALPYACAIEMMHASSLIHDDLPSMDNDDFRRGKLSNHKKFGESVALLAGDALIINALNCIINNHYFDNNVNAIAYHVLSAATGDSGMLAGQTIDTCPDIVVNDLGSLINLHKLKTVKLISASVQLGCIAANVSFEDSKYISFMKYAENVGLAFQIVDDILDYQEGNKEENSFLSYMTLEEAKRYADNLTNEGILAIESYDDGTLTDLALYLTTRKF